MMAIQQISQPDLLEESKELVISRKLDCDTADYDFYNEIEDLVMLKESEIENAMTQAIQHHPASLAALFGSSALIFCSP